jgi:FlaA1/EpsC-like NDP-sugar epimerase
MNFVNVNEFISEHVTMRDESYFAKDLATNNQALEKRIAGKSFLVIGGAGTIGSNFIKAVLPFRPGKLIVVDTSENGLTELVRDLRSSLNEFIPNDFITYPIDYGLPVFAKMFAARGPFDVIANFAAHKHVRSEKDVFSIEAMFRNNVFSVQNLCELALKNPPQHFFCVSTDKAANPVNVMGASKKVMEELLMAYASVLPIKTARFANVAFSNGSLLHGFIDRILKKQPLSSPKDVKRYFVSPQESGQLCMLACMLGDSGQVFFPKLNPEQMKTFSEIATEFLASFGLEALEAKSENEARQLQTSLDPKDNKYPVYYFKSDTSGEKMFEEFVAENEVANKEKYEGLGFIDYKTILSVDEANEMVKDFIKLFNESSTQKTHVIDRILKYIPNFDHIETNKNLDQKM